MPNKKPMNVGTLANGGTALAACSMWSKIVHLEARNRALAARVDVLCRLLNANGLRSITEAANFLNVKKMDLFRFLDNNDWVSRPSRSGRAIASPEMVNSGYLAQKVMGSPGDDMGEQPYGSVLVTPKGLVLLVELLKLVPKVQE